MPLCAEDGLMVRKKDPNFQTACSLIDEVRDLPSLTTKRDRTAAYTHAQAGTPFHLNKNKQRDHSQRLVIS